MTPRTIISGGVLAAGLIVTVAVAPASAQQVPIQGTGWTQDFVVEAGGTYGPGTLTATMDSGKGGVGSGANTWYQVGQDTAAPATGIPSGTTFTSAADPGTSFFLQPATGNNGILIDGANTGTFTLSTPAAYSTLSFATSTGAGNATIGYTVNFADGGTFAGTFASPDWFNGNPTAYTANGRINNNGYDQVGNGNPRIYQEDVSAANFGSLNDSLGNLISTEPINSISFTLSGGGGHTDLQAISGTASAVPEPGTWVAAGGLLLLAAGDFRRRLKA